MKPAAPRRSGPAGPLAMLAAVLAGPLVAQAERPVLAPDRMGCLVDDATLEAVGA